MRDMGLALLVQHQLKVAVVGGHRNHVILTFRSFNHPRKVVVNIARARDFRVTVGGVPNHIAVGKVGNNEIIALFQPLDNIVRDLGQAQLGHGVKRHALGGGDADVVLAGERLVIAAVKEECHMGEFFGLRAVQLGQPVLAEHLRQRALDLGRRERNRQPARVFVVVHGQDDEIQPVNRLPLKMRELLIGKRVGQLDFALAPAAAEQHRVAVLYLADGRAVRADAHHRL